MNDDLHSIAKEADDVVHIERLTHQIQHIREDQHAMRAALEAIDIAAGTMDTTVNTAEYPEGYGDPSYNGPFIEPTWTVVETLETIHRLGFAGRAEFEAEYAALKA